MYINFEIYSIASYISALNKYQITSYNYIRRTPLWIRFLLFYLQFINLYIVKEQTIFFFFLAKLSIYRFLFKHQLVQSAGSPKCKKK